MKLLLDTHVLLWWLAQSNRLSAEALKAIANPENAVLVSAATAWEIAIKNALGKVTSPDDLAKELQKHRFEMMPITFAHAIAAGKLPSHHSDPFDRMLIAQAQVEQLTLVTHDKRMLPYGVSIILI